MESHRFTQELTQAPPDRFAVRCQLKDYEQRRTTFRRDFTVLDFKNHVDLLKVPNNSLVDVPVRSVIDFSPMQPVLAARADAEQSAIGA